jgi:hypothetical protein
MPHNGVNHTQAPLCPLPAGISSLQHVLYTCTSVLTLHTTKRPLLTGLTERIHPAPPWTMNPQMFGHSMVKFNLQPQP